MLTNLVSHAQSLANLIGNTQATDRLQAITPVTVYVSRDDPALLEAIVGCFENLDCKDELGWTAAKIAARDGKVRHLEILLGAGAKLERADFTDKGWRTLKPEVRQVICSAATAHEGNQERLDSGLRGNHEPPQPWQEELAESQKKTKARLAAFQTNIQAKHDRINAKMLCQLVMMGSYDNIKKLFEISHPDPSAHNDGQSPLHRAIQKEDHQMVKLLLPHCQDVNRTFEGRNAIHTAIVPSDAEMCRLLLDNGAILRDTDLFSDSSYLHAVLPVDPPSKLEAIVDCFQDIDIKDSQGRTAAKLAAEFGKVRHLEILLAHGAKLRKADFSDEVWDRLDPEIQVIIPDAST